MNLVKKHRFFKVKVKKEKRANCLGSLLITLNSSRKGMKRKQWAEIGQYSFIFDIV